MMAELGLASTAGAKIPTEVNMLQWLDAKPPAPAVTKPDWSKFVRCDIARPNQAFLSVGCMVHSTMFRFQPAEIDNLVQAPWWQYTCMIIAAYCNHGDMLRWMMRTWKPTKIPFAYIAEYMDFGTMLWVDEIQGHPAVCRTLMLAAQRSEVDTALKNGWVCSPAVRARSVAE